MKINRLRGIAVVILGAVFAVSSIPNALAEDPGQAENVEFLEQWKVPVRELPLIAGSPEAEHWIIVYSKWNCQICGMMYQAWQQVLADQTDATDPKIGVVMLPGLSLGSVEPLQQTMFCVWRADPEAYRNVSTLIWGGGLPPNNLPAIRESLAGFMGGNERLSAAESDHADWTLSQIKLSASMLAHLEKVTADTGSYPKFTTTTKPAMGHLGPNSSYRKFLVDQGWRSQQWADAANQADPAASANPARAIAENRTNKAPRLLDQVIDLGPITLAEGAEGRKIEVPAIDAAAVSAISSNHGSLRAQAAGANGKLVLHLAWLEGIGTGNLDTALLVTERSGRKHIVTVKAQLTP